MQEERDPPGRPQASDPRADRARRWPSWWPRRIPRRSPCRPWPSAPGSASPPSTATSRPRRRCWTRRRWCSATTPSSRRSTPTRAPSRRPPPSCPTSSRPSPASSRSPATSSRPRSGRQLRQVRWQAKQAALARALAGSGIDPDLARGRAPGGDHRRAHLVDRRAGAARQGRHPDRRRRRPRALGARACSPVRPRRSSHDRADRRLRPAGQGGVAVASRSLPAGRHPGVRRPPPDRDARRRGDRHGGVRHARALARGGARRTVTSTSPRSRSSASPATRCPRGRPCGSPLASCPSSGVARRRPRGRWPSARGSADAERWYAAEQATWVDGEPGAAGRGTRRHGRRRAGRPPPAGAGACGRRLRRATSRCTART